MLAALAAALAAFVQPDPSAFVGRVDNAWFPLRAGTTWIYRGSKDGTPSRDIVTVERGTTAVAGVRCTAVRDRLFLNGKLAERTTDWYAQDRAGNVWYFGEATAELDPSGRVANTEGSWRAGVDGARPGILMPARPKAGQRFAQEYYAGHAEDRFQVLSVSRRKLLTKEWSPLEPGVIDHKRYTKGVGMVSEATVRGGSERAVLVSERHD